MNNNDDASLPNRNFGDDLTNLPQNDIDQIDRAVDNKPPEAVEQAPRRPEWQNIPYFDDIYAFLRSREVRLSPF